LQKNAVYANPIVKQLESGAAVGDPVQVRISGKDLETLDRLNAQVKQLMARTPGTLSIKDDWGTPVKKLVVDVKQDRAKRVGLSSRDIAYSLNMQYDGVETTQYREEDEIIPIVVRSDDAKRTDIGKIEGLNVYSFSGEGSIPLAQLAETRLEWTRAKIYRRDRQRTITVSCQVKDGYFASEIFKALEEEMQLLSKEWPFGYKYEYGGQDEESAKANKSIMDQLPLALIIIAFLMILQFNSFGRVAIILVTIPLGIIGVAWGLLISGKTFGFMALLGIISLAGVIINNAIVLIDQIDINRSEGNAPQEAVVLAALSRMRPIMLTTVTTIGGLIPLMLYGGDFWSPMAVAILSGLAFATVLTLGLVPMLYSVLFKLQFNKEHFM